MVIRVICGHYLPNPCKAKAGRPIVVNDVLHIGTAIKHIDILLINISVRRTLKNNH
jgi:hypothetical protein